MSQLMFEELLQQDTRAHLAHTARLLGIRIKSSQRKGEVVATIAGAIKDSPQQFLRQLPLQELLRLRKLVFSEYLALPHNLFSIPDCLEQIGMVHVIEVKEPEKDELMVDLLPADLAAAFKPVITQVAEQASADQVRNEREQLLFGLLNLHGILNLEELTDQATGLTEGFGGQQVHDFIRESFLLKSMEIEIFGEPHFCSPYVNDIDFTLTDILDHWEIKRARFTFRQAMDAGTWAQPLPPDNPATKQLRLRLAEMIESEEPVSQLLSHYWTNLNNEVDLTGPFTKIAGRKYSNLKELQAVISVLMDWSNHTHRWFLKGNTPMHVAATYKPAAPSNQPPRLMLGQNARAAGLDIPQEEFNRLWEQSTPAPKVGRNQPCPCGSGKKYKNCCMRK